MTLSRPGIDLSFDHLLQMQQYAPVTLRQLKPASASLAGRFRSRLKGRGMEFDEVRQYQAGDDIRTIDWRVTARTGKTHTKVYCEERERPVIVVVDLSRTMRFGSHSQLKSFQAAQLAAQLLWSASKQGDRFGALIFNDNATTQLRPKRRSSTLMGIFSKLVQFHQHLIDGDVVFNHDFFNQNLNRLRQLSKTGALIHLISDFNHFDQQSQKNLSLLSRHNQVVAWQVQDPLEIALPDTNLGSALAVTDGINQGIIEPANRQYKQRYHQAAIEKKSQLEHRLRQLAIPLISISTDKSLALQLSDEYLGAATRSNQA